LFIETRLRRLNSADCLPQGPAHESLPLAIRSVKMPGKGRGPLGHRTVSAPAATRERVANGHGGGYSGMVIWFVLPPEPRLRRPCLASGWRDGSQPGQLRNRAQRGREHDRGVLEGVQIPATTLQGYRYSCIGALFYREEHLSGDCLGKAFKQAGIRHRCDHDSLLGSSTMPLSDAGAEDRGQANFPPPVSATSRRRAVTARSRRPDAREGRAGESHRMGAVPADMRVRSRTTRGGHTWSTIPRTRTGRS
jgi:hypothetical protein